MEAKKENKTTNKSVKVILKLDNLINGYECSQFGKQTAWEMTQSGKNENINVYRVYFGGFGVWLWIWRKSIVDLVVWLCFTHVNWWKLQ